MTIEQIQAAIDAKADARQIINMIADYIQANPGGGGGLTLYSGDSTIASDRTVDLNGKSLSIQQATIDLLKLQDGGANLQAIYSGVVENTAQYVGGANIAQANLNIFTDFNGVKNSQIALFADATTATLVYTADTHVVTGVPVFADNAAAVTGGLAVGTIYRTGDLMKIVHA